MNRKNVLGLVLVGFILTGCGGSKSSKNNVDNKISLPSKTALLEALSKSHVVCGEPNLECPNNVAKLVFWQKDDSGYNMGVCSGTVIDKNHILTNSHCIPTNLKTGSSCDSQILVQFPKTKTSRAENINCISVEQVYDYKNKNQPDLAVLKIEESKINKFDSITIVENDFQHTKKVYAYTMNPGNWDRPYLGTIKRKDCNVSFDSIVKYSSTATDKDFLISGDECNVILFFLHHMLQLSIHSIGVMDIAKRNLANS